MVGLEWAAETVSQPLYLCGPDWTGWCCTLLSYDLVPKTEIVLSNVFSIFLSLHCLWVIADDISVFSLVNVSSFQDIQILEPERCLQSVQQRT